VVVAPVLGLIFLRFVDNSFTKVEAELKGKATGRRTAGKLDYQAKGVMYLPDAARFSRLLNAPEGADTGKLLNEAMKAVERENEDLKDVLPKTYQRIDNTVLVELLKIMSGIPLDMPGDAFSKIYEYFLGEFAMKERQKGGELFTPPSMVDLSVEIIEPFHGRLLDPANGGGGTSTGGVYSVSGTIGQPDAGAPMTGAQYSLTGGFWSFYAVQTPGALLLTITLTPTNTAMVYWPSPSIGWTLQENTNSVSSAIWNDYPNPQDNGTSKYIILTPPAGNRFYRLKK
jgi:HsdM N-terminal domain/N-6 DNA Methylase